MGGKTSGRENVVMDLGVSVLTLYNNDLVDFFWPLLGRGDGRRKKRLRGRRVEAGTWRAFTWLLERGTVWMTFDWVGS